jgi:hypothetical protein
MTLSIIYIVSDNEREDWLEEMLVPLRHLPYPLIRYPGVPNDITKARVDAYSDVTTEYVLMMDPDDLVLAESVTACLQFLIDNPEYAACGPKEHCIGVNGEVRSSHPHGDFSLNCLMHTPLEFHGGVVFRTSAVMEFLQVLSSENFYNPDWALRLCIAGKYPVKKLNMVGHWFRRKPNSHHSGCMLQPNQIPSIKTVGRLIELGLLKR